MLNKNTSININAGICLLTELQRRANAEKNMHPRACLRVITAHTCTNSYDGSVLDVFQHIRPLSPPHHSPTYKHTHTDTRTHNYCNSREWATDVPMEVFKAFYHASSTGTHSDGLLWQKHVDNGNATYSWDRGAEGVAGWGAFRWLDGWMSRWLDGSRVVREDRGGLHWDPKRCGQDQMAFVCASVTPVWQQENTHIHTHWALEVKSKQGKLNSTLVKMPSTRYGL